MSVTVAVAYVLHKTPYVFPIVGARKVEQFLASLEGLNISLSDEHIKQIEDTVPFDLGFPSNFIVSHQVKPAIEISIESIGLQGVGTDYPFMYKSAGNFDAWPLPQPIRPAPAASQ